MKTAIVIPQRQRTPMTTRLIKGIRKHEGDIAIVVVNDCTRTRPKFKGLDVTVVSSQGNGVTAAWNIGIRAASAARIVLLNNDIICSGRFVKPLCVAVEAGISGAAKRKEPKADRKLLQGWCMAFTMKLFNQLDGFDPRLKCYFSDTDFQLRALRAGHELKRVDVPLHHIGHATAHDKKLFPDRHAHFGRDGRMFRKLWRDRS